ncbi:MAG: shikimate kinase [Lachnospiraceae bacterium]|nr:shikimate kinase [Lachnospiraceae bacterium]
MTNICLIGYMGSGKSSAGRLAAEILGYDFDDTDDIIVRREGRPITEIFEKNGEAYFRGLETGTLKELCESGSENVLLSTGGGLPVKVENRALLKRFGKVIYLRADAGTLYERVKEDKGRPLLNTDDKLKKIREMLDFRGPIYEEAADHIIDTDDLDAGAVAKEIANIAKSS